MAEYGKPPGYAALDEVSRAQMDLILAAEDPSGNPAYDMSAFGVTLTERARQGGEEPAPLADAANGVAVSAIFGEEEVLLQEDRFRAPVPYLHPNAHRVLVDREEIIVIRRELTLAILELPGEILTGHNLARIAKSIGTTIAWKQISKPLYNWWGRQLQIRGHQLIIGEDNNYQANPELTITHSRETDTKEL